MPRTICTAGKTQIERFFFSEYSDTTRSATLPRRRCHKVFFFPPLLSFRLGSCNLADSGQRTGIVRPGPILALNVFLDISLHTTRSYIAQRRRLLTLPPFLSLAFPKTLARFLAAQQCRNHFTPAVSSLFLFISLQSKHRFDVLQRIQYGAAQPPGRALAFLRKVKSRTFYAGFSFFLLFRIRGKLTLSYFRKSAISDVTHSEHKALQVNLTFFFFFAIRRRRKHAKPLPVIVQATSRSAVTVVGITAKFCFTTRGGV